MNGLCAALPSLGPLERDVCDRSTRGPVIGQVAPNGRLGNHLHFLQCDLLKNQIDKRLQFDKQKGRLPPAAYRLENEAMSLR